MIGDQFLHVRSPSFKSPAHPLHVDHTQCGLRKTLVQASLGFGSVNFWPYTVGWVKGQKGVLLGRILQSCFREPRAFAAGMAVQMYSSTHR